MKSFGVRRTTRLLVATIVAGSALITLDIAVAPAAGPVGYTVVSGSGGCRVVTVDVTTGTTTLLSAPADEDACVTDLAVGLDGSLWGIDITFDPLSASEWKPSEMTLTEPVA